MNYRYIPIIWPLLASGLLTLYLGIFIQRKHRKTKETNFFAASMFIVTFWSLPNALEMAATELTAKLFWANLQYIAYCLSPVSLLVLCLEFTGYNNKIKKKSLLWLAVLPCITLLLVWTNQWHGLIRYDVHMDYSGAFPVIAKKYGSWFYIHALYSYCLNFCAIAMLVIAIFARRSVYRKQAIQLLIGISLIVVPNLIYISGISQLKNDITPVFFGPAGVIMLWSIFHSGMFELVPIARAAVIEAMEAGVIVTDLQDRVLDMNPALKKITGICVPRYYLMSIEEVFRDIPELTRIMKDGSISYADFAIYGEGESRVYEILLTPLYDKKNTCIGRLALIYDITEKKLVQQEYLKQQWRLAVIDERERMSRDLHDNLGQVLGFVNFQTQAIRKELVNEGIELVSDKLDQLIAAVQNAHEDMREYICSNRTSVKIEKNFTTSLKNDIENFEQQTGLSVRLDIPDEPIDKEFDSVVMVNTQNIIREAMNNIRKHAQANKVHLSFSMNENYMIVSIVDDGKGFDVERNEYTVKNSFGLDIMRERAALIGGSVNIESVPNKGSRIMIYVPRVGGDETHENESNAG